MGMLDTIRHHIDVGKAALAAEKEGPGEIERKADELQFMPAALEVMETPASPLGRWTALSLAAFFTIATLWAVFGHIDIVATSQGKIIPSARSKVIQPLETGTIRAIHVTDGQIVSAGEILIELDPTDAVADVESVQAEWITARMEAARLKALLSGEAFVPPKEATKAQVELHKSYLESQKGEHKARLAALTSDLNRRRAESRTTEAEITRLQTILPKIKERVESRAKLVAKKISARLQLLELEEQLADQEGQLAVQRTRLIETRSSIVAAEEQLHQAKAEFRRDTFARLAEAEQQTASLHQQVVKAKERKRLLTLRAPEDAVVQQLAVHTIGGVVTPAQELMVLVPVNTPVEIEAKILNKDIGFVQDGQEAEIKIDAFPFTKYGTIDGTVITVSRDAVEDENLGLIYPARIKMDRTTMLVNDKHVNLSAGMSITLEIKTGKRRLIKYLLAPLQEYQDEAMRER